MSVLFAATSIANVMISDAAQVALETTTARIAPYVREGIGITYTNNSSGADTPDLLFNFPTISQGWISFHLDMTEITTNNWGHYVWALRDIYNKSDSPTIALFKAVNSNTFTVRRLNGASVTDDAFTGITANLLRFDIYFNLHATTGQLTIYINGTSVYNYTGALIQTGTTGLNCITFQREGGDSTKPRTLSGLIVADEDTRTMQLALDYPTGNGMNTAWTGSHLDVDEAGVNTADYIEGLATGDKETYTFPNLAAGLVGMTPVAVMVRASGSASTKQVNSLSRVSGTDYDNGLLVAANELPGMSNNWIALNPATGLAWTQAEINAAEFGVKVA